MNITFLIGNGFDLNLGLKTTYADFINYYEHTRGKTKHLDNFREHILKNEKLWSNTEIALGEFTKEFEVGGGMEFSECHNDMCEHLIQYLKAEESRVSYEKNASKICDAFKNILNPEEHFPMQEKNAIRTVFNRYKNTDYDFNFICFNYTPTLDKCIEIVNGSEVLGKHIYGNMTFNNTIKQLCHVHGTLEKDLIFAVNDESQIAKPEIFDFEEGEICKHLLIKQQANESYQENTDTIAYDIIKNSQIIYIYGMSLGKTDALWWNRICEWLNGNYDRHLIIHMFNMSIKKPYPLNFQIDENKKKKEILSFSAFDKKIASSLMNRIHITSYNIFSEIMSLVNNDTQQLKQAI